MHKFKGFYFKRLHNLEKLRCESSHSDWTHTHICTQKVFRDCFAIKKNMYLDVNQNYSIIFFCILFRIEMRKQIKYTLYTVYFLQFNLTVYCILSWNMRIMHTCPQWYNDHYTSRQLDADIFLKYCISSVDSKLSPNQISSHRFGKWKFIGESCTPGNVVMFQF